MLKEVHLGDKVFCIIDYQEQLFVFPCMVVQMKLRGKGLKCTVKIETVGGEGMFFDVFDGDLFRRRTDAENERKKREKYA